MSLYELNLTSKRSLYICIVKDAWRILFISSKLSSRMSTRDFLCDYVPSQRRIKWVLPQTKRQPTQKVRETAMNTERILTRSLWASVSSSKSGCVRVTEPRGDGEEEEGNYTAPFLSETPSAELWYGGKQRLCSRLRYLTFVISVDSICYGISDHRSSKQA